MPMFLTRNDESEERHKLPYVWHSRSTWAVSATTEHTDCVTKGGTLPDCLPMASYAVNARTLSTKQRMS